MSYLRFLAYLLGAVFGLVAIALILLFTIDLGVFKPLVEQLASDILDRDFEIQGPLALNLGSSIEMSAGEVRLAGTPWSAEPDLISVEKLQVAVDFRSLLQGPILIERLYANGIRVHLEKGGGDTNNWVRFEKTESEPPPSKRERFRLPLFATDIRITNTLLTYAEPERSEPLRLLINSVSGAMVGPDQVKVTLAGEYNDTPLGLQVTSTGVENLITLLDVSFDFSGNLGEVVFNGNVAFADLLDPRQPTGMVKLDGPNMEYLLTRLQVEPFTSGPLNLALEVAPRDEKMHLVLAGVFGEFDLSAQGSFVDLQQLERIDLQFEAGGPDLGRIAGLAGLEHVPNDPFTVDGALHRSGADIAIDAIAVTIGETRFSLAGEFKDFPDPDKARATIRLQGPDIGRFSRLLGLPGKLDGPFNLEGRLEPLPGDEGAVFRLDATTNDLELAADGNILDTADFVGSDIRFNLSGPTLSTVTTALELDNTLDLPFSVDAAIERVAGGANISDGRITLGEDAEYTASLAATVTDDAGLLGSQVEVRAQGPSLAELASVAGVGVHGKLPFDLFAEVTVVDAGYALDAVRAKLGENRATLTGLVGVSPLAADTDVKFSVTTPDLQASLAAFGMGNANLPSADLDASGVLSTEAGRINLQDILVRLADTTVRAQGKLGELPGLEGSAVHVDVAGRNLSQLLPPGLARISLARPFSLAADVRLAQKWVRIESARLEIADSVFTADTRFEFEPLLDSGQFSLRGKSPDLLPLLPEVAELSLQDTLPLDLVAEGLWAGNLWTVKQLELKFAGSNLRARGRLTLPPGSGKTDLRVTGKVDSVQPFSKLAGWPLPDEAGNISLHLVGQGDAMTLKTFEGRLGDSDFKGDFSLRYADVPDIRLVLTSKRLNLEPYLPLEPEPDTGIPGEPAPPEDPTRRLIPATPLPMDKLKKLQARVDLHVGEINLGAETLTDVVLTGSIEDGALAVDEFRLKASQGGILGGSLSLRPDVNGAVLGARIDASNLSIGLLAATAQELKTLPRYQFTLALVSAGETVREMAGSANGYLRLVAGKGQVKATVLRLLTDDFLDQLLTTVNPFAIEDPYTHLHCGVVLAAVEAGQLVGKPIMIMKTDRLNIFADAEIDLRTEKLKATFNTVPQKGLGISLSNLVNPYVAVVGTLGNPQITLDPEATVIEGGTAVATMGLSILWKGFKDRFLSSTTPCEDALKKADQDLERLEAKYASPTSN